MKSFYGIEKPREYNTIPGEKTFQLTMTITKKSEFRGYDFEVFSSAETARLGKNRITRPV